MFVVAFRAVVARVLDIPPDDVVNDLGPSTFGRWTSLKHIQLIAAMEDEYAVRFSPNEIRSVRSVGVLREVLRQKGVSA